MRSAAMLAVMVLVLGASKASAQVVGDASAPVVLGLDLRNVDELSGAFVGGLLAGSDATVTQRSELCVASLPMYWLVGQVIMTGVSQAEYDRANQQVAEGILGGIMVRGTPGPDIGGYNAGTHKTSIDRWSVPAMIAVDEEGGRVQRLERAIGSLPSAASVAATMTPQDAEDMMAEHGSVMAEMMFTVDFAPVLDVGGDAPIGDRSYGDDPAVVDTYGAAAAAGLASAGILPTYKHFPGHGTASADSHLSLPVTAPIEQLRSRDLLPFEAAIERGDGAIMVGHLLVPGLTEELPTSLSPAAVNGLLRTELGFDGLVFTDSLDMGAIVQHRSIEDAAVLALVAGNDVALLASLGDVFATHERILLALESGELPETRLYESVRRILEFKQVEPCSLKPQELVEAP